MSSTTKSRVVHRAAGSGLQHAQDRLQKNRNVLHALGDRSQPKDFPSDRSPEADDFVGVSLRKFDHSVALHSSRTISAAGKAAGEFSPHHLLPVHILPPGTPKPNFWNVPPGPVQKINYGGRLFFFLRNFGGVSSTEPAIGHRSADGGFQCLGKVVGRAEQSIPRAEASPPNKKIPSS